MRHAATKKRNAKQKKEVPHAATRSNIIRMAGVRIVCLKVLTKPVLI
jgi:hypothetical protein